MNLMASTRSGEGESPSRSPSRTKPVGEFQMINVGDFRMIIDTARNGRRLERPNRLPLRALSNTSMRCSRGFRAG